MSRRAYADSFYLQKCRELASLYCEDSDVTNADAATLKKFTEQLAESLHEKITDYIADEEREAANAAEQREQYHYEKARGYDV